MEVPIHSDGTHTSIVDLPTYLLVYVGKSGGVLVT